MCEIDDNAILKEDVKNMTKDGLCLELSRKCGVA